METNVTDPSDEGDEAETEEHDVVEGDEDEAVEIEVEPSGGEEP